jgi:hypothetical protein
MVPVGVVGPADDTKAVRVTSCPTTDGFVDAAIDVVVALSALVTDITVCDDVPELDE